MTISAATMKKIANGEDLSAEEDLALAESRPIPTTKEWWVLWLVWATRFSFDLDMPISVGRLQFLRRHLSAALFSDLTRSLRSSYAETFGQSTPVAMRTVKRMLNRKRYLKRLRQSVQVERERAKLLSAQRTIANG